MCGKDVNEVQTVKSTTSLTRAADSSPVNTTLKIKNPSAIVQSPAAHSPKSALLFIIDVFW